MIQFPRSAFPEFDDLVRQEDRSIDVLADAHDVDGHDIGRLTADPPHDDPDSDQPDEGSR